MRNEDGMGVLDPVTARAGRVLAPNPGPMTLEGTNTWILREPNVEACVVVDPGPLDEGHLAAVADQGPVALVVLTHGHDDHAGGAGRFHEMTGAPVLARDPALCLGIEALDDDEKRTVADVEWLSVLTPGHSSDSICLLLDADGALLTGDTVLGRGTTVVAHPDGRLADYLESLQRLRDLATDEVGILLPGHGPPVTAPIEALDYYLEQRRERLEQVRQAVADGATDAMDVVRRVYADVDRSVWFAAEKSVL